MEDRRSERLPADAQVHTLKHGTRRAHRCGNISRLGCMIADEGLFAATGDEFDVELAAGVVMPSRVIWARQGQLGLAFRYPIDRATVRLLATGETQPPREPGLRDRMGRLLPEKLVRFAA